MPRKAVGEAMARVPDTGWTEMQDAHARYAALVDKKFVSTLSEAEQAELSHLEDSLNKIEAEYYEPVKKKLRAALGASTKA